MESNADSDDDQEIEESNAESKRGQKKNTKHQQNIEEGKNACETILAILVDFGHDTVWKKQLAAGLHSAALAYSRVVEAGLANEYEHFEETNNSHRAYHDGQRLLYGGKL